MKPPKLPPLDDLRLSLLHHSLPIEIIAHMHSTFNSRQRKWMVYARVDDAARILCVPRTTLRTRVSRGQLPSIEVDGKPVVRMPDARAIVARPPQRGRPKKPRAA